MTCLPPMAPWGMRSLIVHSFPQRTARLGFTMEGRNPPRGSRFAPLLCDPSPAGYTAQLHRKPTSVEIWLPARFLHGGLVYFCMVASFTLAWRWNLLGVCGVAPFTVSCGLRIPPVLQLQWLGFSTGCITDFLAAGCPHNRQHNSVGVGFGGKDKLTKQLHPPNGRAENAAGPTTVQKDHAARAPPTSTRAGPTGPTTPW
jgi:hypothetical protein